MKTCIVQFKFLFKKESLRISFLFVFITIFLHGISWGQNVGINEPNPTHTLHIKPLNPGDEPIRIEGVQAAVGGENGVLIHNTADGIVRFITIGQVQDQIDTHLDSLSFDANTNILSAWVNGVNHDVFIPSGTGPQGPAGEDGQDGNDGLSAYEIWLNEGNVGSEADFIASLQGDPGPAGPQGDPGPQGPQGDPGPTWNITSDNFNANGNLVIQTDQPATITSTNAAWLTTGNQGTGTTNFLGTIPNQPLIFRTNNTERMRIQGNGNIGIGTNNPATYLQFNRPAIISNFHTMWDNTLADDAIARFQHTNALNGSRVLFGISNYNANTLASPGVIGLHLNNFGNGGIGVEGFSNSNDGTGILAGFVGGNTFVNGWALLSNGWAGGTTAWQNISDERLKKDIKVIDSPLSKIMQIQGVEYYYDNTFFPELRLDEETLQMGFIAQNIESVFPHLVREANIPGLPERMDNSTSREKSNELIKTFSYSNIVPLLLEGIKEQQSQIQSLEDRIEALEKLLNEK
jgi:hypothetical protein